MSDLSPSRGYPHASHVEVRRSCQPFPENSGLCDLQSAASEEADSAAGRRSWKGRESAQRRLEFQNPAQRTHVAAAMHQQARISPCKTQPKSKLPLALHTTSVDCSVKPEQAIAMLTNIARAPVFRKG
jgi:hypothetical protein